MKKWIVVSAALLTLVFLAACAPTAKQHSYKSVKCPACGYQFEMPKSPGN